MTCEQQRTEPGSVAGAERVGELQDPLVLGDDVAGSRLVAHHVERRVAQRSHAEPGGDALAVTAPFCVRAVRKRAREPRVDHQHRQRVRERDRLGAQRPAVDEQCVAGPTEQRDQLVHHAARHARGEVLAALARPRQLRRREREPCGIRHARARSQLPAPRSTTAPSPRARSTTGRRRDPPARVPRRRARARRRPRTDPTPARPRPGRPSRRRRRRPRPRARPTAPSRARHRVGGRRPRNRGRPPSGGRSRRGSRCGRRSG